MYDNCNDCVAIIIPSVARKSITQKFYNVIKKFYSNYSVPCGRKQTNVFLTGTVLLLTNKYFCYEWFEMESPS